MIKNIEEYRKMKEDLMLVKTADGMAYRDFIYAEHKGSQLCTTLDKEKAGFFYYNYMNARYERALSLNQPWTSTLYNDIKKGDVILLMMVTGLRPFEALEVKTKQLYYTESFYEKILVNFYYEKQQNLTSISRGSLVDNIEVRTRMSYVRELDIMWRRIGHFLDPSTPLGNSVDQPNTAVDDNQAKDQAKDQVDGQVSP